MEAKEDLLEQVLIKLDELDDLRRQVRESTKRKPRLMDVEEAADYLRLKPDYLQQKASSELGIKSMKIGKYLRFDIKDLDEYIQRQPRRGDASKVLDGGGRRKGAAA